MDTTIPNIKIIEKLVSLANDRVKRNHQAMPFTASIARGLEVITINHNQVFEDCDPSAHAEIVAIRMACKKLNTISLKGYDLYSNCEPCPMCLAAAYWTEVSNVYFLNSMDFIQQYFNDSYILKEIKKPHYEKTLNIQQINFPKAQEAFLLREQLLKENNGKVFNLL